MIKRRNREEKTWGSGLLRPKKSEGIVLITLAVLAVLASGALVWTASNLTQSINRRTRIYAQDVSTQVANNIAYRLRHVVEDLEMLRDATLEMRDTNGIEKFREYLSAQTGKSGYDAFVVVDTELNAWASQEIDEEWTNCEAIQSALAGENGMTILSEQSILYTVPIYADSGEVAGAFGGLRKRANMQELIQPQSFSGMRLICIINSREELVIAPGDLAPFLALDEIFNEEADAEMEREVAQLKQDIQQGKNGVIQFTAVNGDSLLLAYNPMGVYDWTLLTLIPADLISHETDIYTAQNFIIVVLVLLLFMVTIFVLFSSDRKHYRELDRIAFSDPVTGGANTSAFLLRCSELLRTAPAGSYTLVALNLKDFKLINEQFGTENGDKTLRHILHSIQLHIGNGELAARAEADNFLVCLRLSDQQAVRQRIDDIVREINSFNATRSEPYYLTVQAGACLVDDPDLEITVLQARAQAACNSRDAHEDGVCLFYDSSLTEKRTLEWRYNNLFANSIENGDFQVYFQPKIRAADERIGGAEALVRWLHPKEGLISPGDFIPVFEKNGRICTLDLFVFTKVCENLRKWIDEGRRVAPVSINLSRMHFSKSDFLDEYAQIARKYELPAGLIELELTESIFFDDNHIEIVRAQIRRMHELGFRCSLDDFGSGFSSLGLLMEFDVDTIKMDRRFFQNIERPKTEPTVCAIVELAHRLGATVVAEGIETEDQLALIRRAGGDFVQGYYYAKPMPTDAFEEWVTGWNAQHGFESADPAEI